MTEHLSRTALQFGREGMERLSKARVAVFGIGGVGGYCVEALARSGVGAIDLFDPDTVCLSNLNRQIIATRDTLGMSKVEAMKARVHSIDPSVKVEARPLFFSPETGDAVDFSAYSYVVDAVDTVTAKLEIICRCQGLGVPVISAMGAGNKLDPTAFVVADIYETSGCPLARVMRRELRKRGIVRQAVVYSKEAPLTPKVAPEPDSNRRSVPSSNAFVPAVAGLILASHVLRELAGI